MCINAALFSVRMRDSFQAAYESTNVYSYNVTEQGCLADSAARSINVYSYNVTTSLADSAAPLIDVYSFHVTKQSALADFAAQWTGFKMFMSDRVKVESAKFGLQEFKETTCIEEGFDRVRSLLSPLLFGEVFAEWFRCDPPASLSKTFVRAATASFARATKSFAADFKLSDEVRRESELVCDS